MSYEIDQEERPDEQIVATEPPSPYTQAMASDSLRRASRIVVVFAVVGACIAFAVRGWQSAALLLVGAAISGSGLLEWRRLMVALMSRMDAQDAVQAGVPQQERKGPSIGFAIAGFVVRLLVVIGVLYVSLKYLNGSVLALAAGLAMGVFALLLEGFRLLRSGTI